MLLNVKNEFMCVTRAVKGRPKLGVVCKCLLGLVYSFNRPRTDIDPFHVTSQVM